MDLPLAVVSCVFMVTGVWVVLRPERQARALSASLRLWKRPNESDASVDLPIGLARLSGAVIGAVGVALLISSF
jgi:hypothetical protein